MSVPIAEAKLVSPDQIVFLEADNPNTMSETGYLQLKVNIMKRGFLQRILVLERDDGKFTLVDGWHRLKAMIELGVDEIPIAVMPIKSDGPIEARMMRMAMNMLRGQSGYDALTKELKELGDSGVSLEDLPQTGIPEEDIRALLALDNLDLEAALTSGEMATEIDLEDEKPKGFYLQIKVASATEKLALETALQSQAATDNISTAKLLASFLGI